MKRLAVLPLTLAVSAMLAACASPGGATTAPSAATEAPATEAPATEAPMSEEPAASPSEAASGSGPFRAEPLSGDLTGKKIAMLSFGNNPFWEPVEAGAKAAGEKLAAQGGTVDYIVMGAALDMPTVQTAIESAVTQGYDAIGVVPLADGACPAIKAAVEAGHPVATFIAEGTCAQEAGSLFFHGQDGYAAGQVAGAEMGRQINCTGTVAIITGSFGVQIHEDRRMGFEDQLKADCPDVTILPAVENADDAGKAQSLTADFLTAYPDLTGVYVTAGGPFGAATAVKDADKTGQVKVVSFDFVPETVQAVRDGIIAATIGQDPFGEGYNTAILLANYLIDGSKPDQYFVPVTSEVLTKDNADEVLANQQ